jgi:hypothetical protein
MLCSEKEFKGQEGKFKVQKLTDAVRLDGEVDLHFYDTPLL